MHICMYTHVHTHARTHTYAQERSNAHLRVHASTYAPVYMRAYKTFTTKEAKLTDRNTKKDKKKKITYNICIVISKGNWFLVDSLCDYQNVVSYENVFLIQ